jgi:hypothetical protein
MSLAYQPNTSQEYATKTEIHYMLHVTYSAISRAITTGKLAVHLIDGKIQIEVAEAIKVLKRPQFDLFSQ